MRSLMVWLEGESMWVATLLSWRASSWRQLELVGLVGMARNAGCVLGGGLLGGFYEEVLRDADGGVQVGYKGGRYFTF